MRNLKIFLMVASLFFGSVGFSTETVTRYDDGTTLTTHKNGDTTSVDTEGKSKTIKSEESKVIDSDPDAAECMKEGSFADKVCPSTSSPYLQGAVVLINGLLVGAKQMGGVNAACSKYAEALNIANGAMSAYNVGCGYAQMACESSCIRAQNSLTGKINTLSADVTPVTKPQLLAAQKALALVNAKKHSCDTYKMQLAVGTAGLISMVVSAKTAAKCDDGTKTQDQLCKENPALPECAINCALEKYASNTKCICEKNPYTAGCTQSTNTTTTTSTRTNSNVNNKEKTTSDITPGDPSISYGTYPDSSGSATDSGGAAGIAAGGPAAAGKGGGADGSESKGKRTGFNPNILSGDSGGGGGRFGSGSGGYDSSEGSGKYRAYMPGGANDPNRNVAGQGGGASSEVTGGGGKSNWEKVKERYVENKPRMLGSGE